MMPMEQTGTTTARPVLGAGLNQDREDRPAHREAIRALLDQREQLAHLDRLAALKEQSLRIVHDVRNPLATIQAVCASLLLESQEGTQRRRLEFIQEQINKLAKQLRGVVSASGALEDVPVWLDCATLAESLVWLLTWQSDEGLRVVTQVTPGLRCRLPEQGLRRSLDQLLRNARQALIGREPAFIHLTLYQQADWLVCQVEDNGPGFPEAILDEARRGLLSLSARATQGLSSLDRFARGLEGRVELSNRSAGGGRVRLLLPVDGE